MKKVRANLERALTAIQLAQLEVKRKKALKKLNTETDEFKECREVVAAIRHELVNEMPEF